MGVEDGKRLRDARAALLEEQVEVAKLNRKKRTGELIDKDKVGKLLEEVGATLASRLHSMPSRVAPLLAPMSEEHQIRELLVDEVNRTINEMREALGFEEL